MKIKTAELTGPALDWAVAECNNDDIFTDGAGTFRNGLLATILEAAMRCYVASKLGDEIEIPKELLEK